MSNGAFIKKLGLICDRKDPSDQKLLLLGELVEDRFNSLEEGFNNKFERINENQQRLYNKLDETGAKLDSLTDLLSKHQEIIQRCPMVKQESKKSFERFRGVLEHPKMMSLSLIGGGVVLLLLVIGVLNPGVITAIKALFGL